MFGIGRGRMRHRCTDGVSLGDLPRGSSATVTSLAAGRGLRERMASMGIFPGTCVSVLETQGDNGMMLISVGGTRLMVDRTLATAIMVK
jgi:ferrous iron transport protein A